MWILLLLLLLLCAANPTMIPIIILSIVVLIMFAIKQGDEEKTAIANNEEKIMSGKINGFVPTRHIKSMWVNAAMYVDEKHRKIFIVTNMKKAELAGDCIGFDELVECSILEDGATVQSGGIGRAVVGGVVAGGVGAIVGATTRSSKPITRELSVRIVTSNIQNSLHIIPIITSEINRDTKSYKEMMNFAQEIYATLMSIIHSNQTQK